MIIRGKRVYLRPISMDDCTEEYVNWLNDPEVNQFLETRWTIQTIETIKEYVYGMINDKKSLLFAIIVCDNDLHIGNIKIGPINEHHLHADISYFIGNKNYWGMGIATEAVGLICNYGINDLKLHKLCAGAYSLAIGSCKVLEKNGFVKEGVLRQEVFSAGKYIDVYRYGLLDY